MVRKAVITGGTGFIGTHLAKELAVNGYDVTVYGMEKPDDTELNYVQGDIRDTERLQDTLHQVDIVFHLAGALGTEYLVERAKEAANVNILGSLNVYELAREIGFPVVETGLIPDWLSPYMITKKAAAKFGAMYHAEFGTDIRILELSHIYGPGQKVRPYYKAIPTFVTKALRDEPLTVFGRGKRAMDCLYVKDAVRALKMVGECEAIAGRIVTFGSGSAITVLELARKIIAMTNSRSEIIFTPMRKGEPDDDKETGVRGVDLSSWHEFFDWEAQTSLDDGLIATIDWYRTRLEKTVIKRL